MERFLFTQNFLQTQELFIDFDLKHCNDIPKLIEEYVYYYNHERPSYALNYKTPIQYKIESGF